MASVKTDTAEVKELLKSRIVDLCQVLLPGGQVRGRLYEAHNPWVAEDARKLPALKVAVRGDVGAWIDWRHGDKGDVIKLIQFAKGVDFKDAMAFARDWLGLRQMSREDRERLRREAEGRHKRQAADDARRRAFKLEMAQKLFLQGTAAYGAGSAAEEHARAYLSARGCGFEVMPHVNGESFRFGAGTEWWSGAEWKSEGGSRFKAKEGPRFPAIHSAMRQATGVITCCHVTFLDPLEPKKAPVEKAKLMFGFAMGAVIELSHGGGGAFWLPDAKPLPTIIIEGIETGNSVAGSIDEPARVWAAGSLVGIGAAPVQIKAVSEIVVGRDNNYGNAQARSQLDAALEHLEQSGKPLVVVNSHLGDDFNDLMKGEDDDEG
jgi:hypothetical protein